MELTENKYLKIKNELEIIGEVRVVSSTPINLKNKLKIDHVETTYESVIEENEKGEMKCLRDTYNFKLVGNKRDESKKMISVIAENIKSKNYDIVKTNEPHNIQAELLDQKIDTYFIPYTESEINSETKIPQPHEYIFLKRGNELPEQFRRQ